MNYKITLGLILLLLVTGGSFFWLKNRTPTPPTDGDASQGQLLVTETFSIAKVQKILMQANGKSATFQKEGEAWWQNEPARFELNDWAIRDLLEVATSLRSSSQLIPGKNDAPSADKLGFGAALSGQAELKLLDETGKELLWLRLGRFSLGGRAYLAIGNDPTVHVVADRLHQKLLHQPLADWRRKTLHPAALGQIDRMTLGYPDGTIDMKQTDGHWSLADQPHQRIDSESLAAIIGHLSGTFIQKFVAEGNIHPEDFGFNRPTLTLTMCRTTVTDKPQPIVDRLIVGSPSDLANERYYAIWSTTWPNADSQEMKLDAARTVVWEIAKSDLDKLSKKLDDLRDGRILLAPPNEVHEIQVKTAAESYGLKRNGGIWQLASLADQIEPTISLDQMDVAKIIADLSLAKALGYTAGAPTTTAPMARITLLAAGRNEPETLTIRASEKPNQRLVYRNDEPVGYYINARLVDALTRPAVSLRDRTLLAIVPEKIKQVTLRYRGQKAYVFSRADSAWTLNGQSAYEKPALDALLKTLASLRVTRWVVEVPPTQPMADLTLQVISNDAPPLPFVMHLNIKGRIAYVPGLNLAELDEAAVATLTAEMADRTVISLSPADISQLTIQQAGQRWTIKRLDSGRYFSDERLELSHANAAAAMDALGGLRAVRFVDASDFDQATPWAMLDVSPSNQTQPLRLQLARRDQELWGRINDRTFLIDSTAAEKLQRLLSPAVSPAKP